MLARVIDFSLNNRLLVIVLVALMAAAGVWSALKLPIDAVPDMTNVQVTVITDAGSLSPVEVERFVTNPVEAAMSGLPKVEELRSISKFGLSVVTLVFDESTDIYWARQLVAERLTSAAAMIPAGYGIPEIGPLATALGEILQFEVQGKAYSITELRTILDWEIVPKLRHVPGVSDVNVHGGLAKTFEVRPRPDQLASYGISLEDVFAALEANNRAAGGGYVVHHDEQRFIRGQAMIGSLDQISQIVLRVQPSGTTVFLGDIADVAHGFVTRQGCATRDAKGEIITGMVMMRIGENSREVAQNTKVRLREIAATLPPGVELEIIYDRTDLIARTVKTIMTNLVDGGLLVVAVLLIMLGSFRAGLITALAIPLSMLFAANMMHVLGITASLMSLGAIDFGLIVDSSVIMIENCMHRMAQATGLKSRLQIVRDAALEVRTPTMFGELIICVVYLPILMLEGTEGKLFRPMALTVLCALAGSLLLSLTLMPVLATIGLPRKAHDRESLMIRAIKWLYAPVVRLAIDNPAVTIVLALAVFGASIPVALNLGAEFMPRLEEGDILIEANRLPSASLEGAVELSRQIEQTLLTFPEIRTVFCKTGRPEIANDVMGTHQTDVWAMLKPRHAWPTPKTRDELVAEFSDALYKQVPSAVFGFTQPIEMRVDELVAGVKADIAVLLYGDDLAILASKAKEIERLLKSIPGAVDVKADYQANLTTITIVPNHSLMARYGVDAEKVMNVVSAVGGHLVGLVFEGRARFPLVVRIPDGWRNNIELLGQLPVSAQNGKAISLGDVADIRIEETPPGVEHEAGRRRTFIAANVRGRDAASFVIEAQRLVADKVELPSGYEVIWGGDFENLRSASLRLTLITPIVLLLIFMLLHATFRSISLALLIFLAVPMAASGGVFALWLRGMPFSISAGVGFIALFGVAVLNGLVWVSSAEALRQAGQSRLSASRETALARLRAVLLTATVASLGFLPMALSHGDGAEMQRPLATVVIGGLITSTLLTTLLLPAIYPLFPRGLEGEFLEAVARFPVLGYPFRQTQSDRRTCEQSNT